VPRDGEVTVKLSDSAYAALSLRARFIARKLYRMARLVRAAS
jgi:hypothetical protein